MTLNKRYKRNIKENLSFYIVVTILTAVSLFLFYLFYICGTGIKEYGDDFFERNNLEDASFTTYFPISDTYATNSYLTVENNARVEMVDAQANRFLGMALVFLVGLPLVTGSLISIILGRKVKSEQKVLGTLRALGVTKKSLERHYAVLAVIPGLIGGILATLVTLLLQLPYGEVGLTDFEPMQVVFRLPPRVALIGILVPTGIYAAVAMRKVQKLLRNDVVTLLNGNARKNGKFAA